MMFFGLVFWVAIIAGLVWLLGRGQGVPQPPVTRGQNDTSAVETVKVPQPPVTRGQNALDILNQRYARGELSREQYDQMRRDLER